MTLSDILAAGAAWDAAQATLTPEQHKLAAAMHDGGRVYTVEDWLRGDVPPEELPQ